MGVSPQQGCKFCRFSEIEWFVKVGMLTYLWEGNWWNKVDKLFQITSNFYLFFITGKIIPKDNNK